MRLIPLPFLVHKCIAGQLGLLEIFALANVSKRCKIKVHSWLIPRQFKIVYNTSGFIKIGETYSDESHNENLEVSFIDQSEQLLVHEYQLWTMLNCSSVAVHIVKNMDSTISIKTYWPDSKQIHTKMLEFVVGVFPRSVVTLEFQTGNMDAVSNILHVTKTLNISVKTVYFRPIEERREDNHDEFVKLLFDDVREAKNMSIQCEISRNFDYACPTSFNFESIIVAHAEVYQFNEGRAYVIKAIDGTEVLVCKHLDIAILTVHYRIGEEVDRMTVDFTG